MNSVDLLLHNAPTWVEVESRQDGLVVITATQHMPGTSASRLFHLKVWASAERGVAVAEQNNRRQLPEFCLERHINPDSTFCLFLGSELPLADEVAAQDWWSNLASYLTHQVYAEGKRVWPLSGGLSHGDAAHQQLKMEELADPLGWKDDILLALFRGKGWLAGRLPRISKSGSRVLNVRSSCPRGCTQKHKLLRKASCDQKSCYSDCRKQHKPVLRRDCPNRIVVEKLILLENRRRQIERDIIDRLKKDGKKCCGTMKNCPLKYELV